MIRRGLELAKPWLVVVTLAAAAIVVSEHRARIAAVIERLTHPETAGDQGRLLKHNNQAIARGTRFFTDNFVPSQLINVGAAGDLDVLSQGYNLRFGSAASGAGLYFVYGLAIDQAYSVELDGEVLRGSPDIRFRCHDWGLSGDRQSAANLLHAPSALMQPPWLGNARLEVARSADGADGPYTRVTFTPVATHFHQGADPVWPRRLLQLRFRARLVSGGPHIAAYINRGGGEDAQGKTISLDRDWQDYWLIHDGTWTGRTAVQAVLTRASADVTFDVQDVRLIDQRMPDAKTRNVWGRAWDTAGTRYEVAGGGLPSGKPRYLVSGTATLGVRIESASPFSYRLNSIRLNPWSARPRPSASCGASIGSTR